MNMPKHADEIALWNALVEHDEKPRYAAQRLGIPWRRVYYIVSKWSDKGLYEWGTSADLGWLIDPDNAVPLAAPDST